MDVGKFSLLGAFRGIFEGTQYKHRNSTLGDFVACHLYEDLVSLNASKLLTKRVASGQTVVNIANRTMGKPARRGDGTFGELIPASLAITADGFTVLRGEVANIQIGVETKILAKAMIKQIDRVIGDLSRQVAEFKSVGGNPICVAIVGVNFATSYCSDEGGRSYPTDGLKHKHPFQEASQAEARLLQKAKPLFDEFFLARFMATNTPPYEFGWVDSSETQKQYAAMLLRIAREYDRRFV